MSRIVQSDFDKLKNFISEYKLVGVLEDKALILGCSQIHKKYYSLMALVYELELIELKGNKTFEEKEKDFFYETVSDIGNALFLMINGAYKPSRLILRSSIETFLKAYSISALPEIDKEKKIYSMFEKVSELPIFSGEQNKSIYHQIQNFYSELSKDTHTATKQQMQHTSSLNYFPTKSKDEIKIITNIIVTLVSHYLFLIASKYNSEFHAIHHENKRVILENINKKLRPSIHNID